MHIAQIIGGWIDTDDRIATPVKQPVKNTRRDTAHIVQGMIGLKAGRKTPLESQGIAKTGDHPAAAGHGNKILIAHQFADRGHHFRGQTVRQSRRVAVIAQQPIPKFAHGQRANRFEDNRIMPIQYQPGYLILLGRDQRFCQEALQGYIGQNPLRERPLHLGFSRQPRQFIRRTTRRGLGHQFAQVLEKPFLIFIACPVGHVLGEGNGAFRGSLENGNDNLM